MADTNTTVHIGENSPEQVAFKLLDLIGKAEGKKLGFAEPVADRQWILDTYKECLKAVKDPF
jgi:hypothetical protein